MSQEGTSFHQLYSRYAGDVYRFAFWLTGDVEEAKDITSETFVRLWTSTSEIRHQTVKGYLLTIARNLSLRSKRRKKRFGPIDAELADAAARPDEETEIRSDFEETLKVMQSLSEPDRAILLMTRSSSSMILKERLCTGWRRGAGDA